MASSDLRPRSAALLTAALLTLTATPAPAGAPVLHLHSTRGELATLPQLLARADATVFVFWSAGCPCVRRYQGRVDALAEAWASRGVAFVEVSSNADETLDTLRAAETARGLRRPLWRDEHGALAQHLGARSTPTVVLVRRDGVVLFRGWFDNERLPGEADRKPWLEDALAGFRDGARFAASSRTWGCRITRALAEPAADCHAPPEGGDR